MERNCIFIPLISHWDWVFLPWRELSAVHRALVMCVILSRGETEICPYRITGWGGWKYCLVSSLPWTQWHHWAAWSWAMTHLLQLIQVPGNSAPRGLSAPDGEVKCSHHWDCTQHTLEIMVFFRKAYPCLVYLLIPFIAVYIFMNQNFQHLSSQTKISESFRISWLSKASAVKVLIQAKPQEPSHR